MSRNMSDPRLNRYFDTVRTAKLIEQNQHRAVVGGMWDEIGQLQFAYLRENGLRPEHKLLDVGCGSMRGGVKFIPYLEPAHYYGLDLNPMIIEAGYEREIVPASLAERLPRSNLRATDSFDAKPFEQRFDYVLAQSVFTHVPWNDIRLCLEQLCDVMEDRGLFFATYFELPDGTMSKSEITQQPGDVVTYPNMDPYHYRLSDFEHACRGLPWRIIHSGEWEHPRAQRMLQLQFG
jgi:hypothetical protein